MCELTSLDGMDKNRKKFKSGSEEVCDWGKLVMALELFRGAVKSAASKRCADGLTAVPWIQTGNGTGPITEQLLALQGVGSDTHRSLQWFAPPTKCKNKVKSILFFKPGSKINTLQMCVNHGIRESMF